MHEITVRMTIKLMVNFMGGRARNFFMKHVALRPAKWTVRSVMRNITKSVVDGAGECKLELDRVRDERERKVPTGRPGIMST